MFNGFRFKVKYRYMLLLTVITSSLVLSYSYLTRNPNLTEQNRINNPAGADKEWLNKYFELGIKWAKETELEYYSKGRPLTVKEKDIAIKMGVSNPDKIRMAIVDKLPLPENKELLKQAKRFGFGSSLMIGLTLGHVVFIKHKENVTNQMLSHEFVHVKQFETLGFNKFLRQYFMELHVVGYPRSPLEGEAYSKQLQYILFI